MHEVTEINKNIERIRERVNRAVKQYSRAAGSVEILAVSKKCSAEAIVEAYNAGLTQFGESYLQEAKEKMDNLAGRCHELQWHFIGPVQSNKTKGIAERFDWVHSVDRLKIAQRLSEQRPESLPPLNICLQVNLSKETSKSGIDLQALSSLVESVSQLERLNLRGLMTIPARSLEFSQQCMPYHQLNMAFEALISSGYQLDTLSMGMTADLEAAISEGATHIRVGRGIFGERS